jgi:hypothetical protein
MVLLNPYPCLDQQALDRLHVTRGVGDVQRDQRWVVTLVQLVARIVEQA